MILPPAHAREATAEGAAARVVHLRRVIAHLEALHRTPDLLELRTEAAQHLARTFPPEKQAEQLERHTSRTMLTGAHPDQAQPGELWIDVLTMHAWAQDRTMHGPLNAGNWAWIEAAQEALRMHARNT